jgi:hypothetical protein
VPLTAPILAPIANSIVVRAAAALAVCMLVLAGCSSEKIEDVLKAEINSTLQRGDDAQKIESLIRSKGWHLESVAGGYRGVVRDKRDPSVVMTVAIRVDDKRRFEEAIVLPEFVGLPMDQRAQ